MFSSDPPAPDAKLLAALPPANRILELGQPDSRVGTAYCQQHPQAQWLRADPDAVTLEGIAGPFDLLVLSDGLPPPEVLVIASAKVSPGATLFAAIDNAASWSARAQLIEADVDAVAVRVRPVAPCARAGGRPVPRLWRALLSSRASAATRARTSSCSRSLIHAATSVRVATRRAWRFGRNSWKRNCSRRCRTGRSCSPSPSGSAHTFGIAEACSVFILWGWSMIKGTTMPTLIPRNSALCVRSQDTWWRVDSAANDTPLFIPKAQRKLFP